jgi:hypothetical protein
VDEESQVFENWMRLCYFNDTGALTNGDDLSVGATNDHYTALIKLYVLADKLIDYTSANKVIDRILTYQNETMLLPRTAQVVLGYSLTTSGSPLRALMRDLVIHKAREGYLGKDPGGLHGEMLADIAVEYLRIKGRGGGVTVGHAFFSPMSDPCVYHHHPNDESKCEQPSIE